MKCSLSLLNFVQSSLLFFEYLSLFEMLTLLCVLLSRACAHLSCMRPCSPIFYPNPTDLSRPGPRDCGGFLNQCSSPLLIGSQCQTSFDLFTFLPPSPSSRVCRFRVDDIFRPPLLLTFQVALPPEFRVKPWALHFSFWKPPHPLLVLPCCRPPQLISKFASLCAFKSFLASVHTPFSESPALLFFLLHARLPCPCSY